MESQVGDLWHPRIEAKDTEERSQYVRLRFDEEQQGGVHLFITVKVQDLMFTR